MTVSYKINIKKYLNDYFKQNPNMRHVFLEELNISSSTLSRWCNTDDSNGPQINDLPKICNFFKISLDVLFGIKPDDLSFKEKKLLLKYRSKTEFQQAINKLLDL